MGLLEFKKSAEWLKANPIKGGLWLLAFVLAAGLFSAYLGFMDDLFGAKNTEGKIEINQSSTGNNSQNIITDDDVTINLGGRENDKN